MDLLSIIQTIWRHKLATIPVIVLTLVLAGYVVAVKKPVYEATSSYILINPPSPPTQDQIDRNPSLAGIKTDNPYTRFADQSVVVDVLARTMSTDSRRQALVKAGADPRFTIAPSVQFGFATPIMVVTGVGSSAQAAMSTATIVGRGFTRELDRIQSAYRTDSRYRIKPQQIDNPDHAQLRASGTLRMLVGVLALGALTLFMVVSVMNALNDYRRQRRAAAVLPFDGPDGLPPRPDISQAELLDATTSRGGHGR